MGIASSPLGCGRREQSWLEISPEPVHAVPVLAVLCGSICREPSAGGGVTGYGLGRGAGLKALLSPVNGDQTCQHPRVPSQKVGASQRFAKVLICTCLGIAQCFKKKKLKKKPCFCVSLDKIQSSAWSLESLAVPNVRCLSSGEGAHRHPQTGRPVGFGYQLLSARCCVSGP